MPKGWKIYSFYKDQWSDKLWHISFAFYTGKRDRNGFGWESKKSHSLRLSEEELIKMLLKHNS